TLTPSTLGSAVSMSVDRGYARRAVACHTFLGRITSPHRQSRKMVNAMLSAFGARRHALKDGHDLRETHVLGVRTEGPNQVTYQAGLKSMKLLPLTGGAVKGLFTKSATKAAEPKGNERPTDPQDRRRLRGEVRGRASLPPEATVWRQPVLYFSEVLIRSLLLVLVLNAF
ncbi:hypothetical protein EDB19DRAFT_1762156, partial [Suillus lakei]